MANDWWSKQFQKMGVAPSTPAPVSTAPPAPQYQTPSDALRSTHGGFTNQDQTGSGTYSDVLKETHGEGTSGYAPDPKKYGVLSDNSVGFYCPNCESPNYFSRKGALRASSRPPAPHCFDCGYNGEAAPMQEALDLGRGVPVAGMARGLTSSHLGNWKDPSQAIAHIK